MSNTPPSPAESGADDTPHPDPLRADGNATDDFDALVASDRVTREQLAKWFYAAGLTTSDIADKLGTDDPTTVTRLLQTYGLAPGRGGHAEEWVIARLPYPWATALRSERGIDAASGDQWYDKRVPDGAVPDAATVAAALRGDEPLTRATAADVPAVYWFVQSEGGRVAMARGLDPADLYEFIRDFDQPDTIPDDGIPGPDGTRLLAPRSLSLRVAALLLVALAADGCPVAWPTPAIANVFIRQAPGEVERALGALAAAGVLDPIPPGDGEAEASWRLRDAAVDVLAGDKSWGRLAAADDAATATGDTDTDTDTDDADADADTGSDPTAGEPTPSPIVGLDGLAPVPAALADATVEDVTAADLADLYYGCGLTYRQIADELGTREPRVSNLMRKYGLNPGRLGEREDAVVERISELDTRTTVDAGTVAARLDRLRESVEYVLETKRADAAGQQTAAAEQEDTTRQMSHNAPQQSDGGQLPAAATTDADAVDIDFEVLPDSAAKDDVERGTHYWALVNNTKEYGVFVSLNNINRRGEVNGLIPRSRLRLYSSREFVPHEDELVVELVDTREEGDELRLDFKPVRWLTKGGTPVAGDEAPAGAETDAGAETTVTDAERDDAFAGLDRQLGDVATVTDDTADTDTDAADAGESDDADADAGTDAQPQGDAADDQPAVEPSGRFARETYGIDAEYTCICGSEFELWKSFIGHAATCDEIPDGVPSRAVKLPSVIAKLYYYYGLSQGAIGEIYGFSPSEASKAMTSADISPGKQDAPDEPIPIHENVRDAGYDWTADLDARGGGRPAGAAATPTDTVLLAALFDDPDVPNPVVVPEAVATSLVENHGIAAETIARSLDMPEPSFAYLDADDDGGERSDGGGADPAPDAGADTDAETEETPMDSSSQSASTDTTAGESSVESERAGDGAVAVPRAFFRREVAEIVEDLAYVPEGSEMFMLAKGRERTLRRLGETADVDVAALFEAARGD